MLYLLLSFLVGVLIVFNMMLGSTLSKKEGMLNSLFINFLMATLSSMALCALMLHALPAYSALRAVPLPYFIGGFIGVLTTYLFNRIVPNVPAFTVVILRFIGQMLTSAVIDSLYFHIFSTGKLIGGLLFLAGLLLNAHADRRKVLSSDS